MKHMLLVSYHSVCSLISHLMSFSSWLVVWLLRNCHETVDRFQPTRGRSGPSVTARTCCVHYVACWKILRRGSVLLYRTQEHTSNWTWRSCIRLMVMRWKNFWKSHQCCIMRWKRVRPVLVTSRVMTEMPRLLSTSPPRFACLKNDSVFVVLWVIVTAAIKRLLLLLCSDPYLCPYL